MKQMPLIKPFVGEEPGKAYSDLSQRGNRNRVTTEKLKKSPLHESRNPVLRTYRSAN